MYQTLQECNTVQQKCYEAQHVACIPAIICTDLACIFTVICVYLVWSGGQLQVDSQVHKDWPILRALCV